MIREPRFDYGPGPTTLEVERSARPWNPSDVVTGDTRQAASGLRVAYHVRNDQRLRFTIRFDFSQWADVYALIDYGRRHPNTITFFPDRLDPLTFEEAYLVEPWNLAPARQSFPNGFELEIELEKVDNSSPWNLDYYAASP